MYKINPLYALIEKHTISFAVILAFIIIISTLARIDKFTWGEGLVTYGLQQVELDQHSYIIYRTENGCAMLHDPSCICREQ